MQQEEAVKTCNGSYTTDRQKHLSSPDTESSSSGAGSIADSLDQESGNVVDVADYSIESKTTQSEKAQQQQQQEKQKNIESSETTTQEETINDNTTTSSDNKSTKSMPNGETNMLKCSQMNSSSLNEDDVQTIKNYQDAEAEEAAINNKKNEIKTTTPTTQEEAVSEVNQEQQQQEQRIVYETDEGRLPAAASFTEDNLQSVRSPLTISKSNINNNNNNISTNNSSGIPQTNEEKTQKTQITLTPTQANNNNNNDYSGLNLNMTASEMRELLARRKKFDPKKAQMNIRQKYEIIQQM